jgi:hypothetical protein
MKSFWLLKQVAPRSFEALIYHAIPAKKITVLDTMENYFTKSGL